MALSEEHVMLQELVAKFVDNELMPLEKAVLARETAGKPINLTKEEETPLLDKCRELGLWALDVPEEVGRREPAGGGAGRRQRGAGLHLRALHLPAGLAQPAHAAGRR